MKKWRLIGGIALMFILGLLVGSAGTRFYYNYRIEYTWNDPAARRAYYLKRLTRELRLNEDQQREFRTMIDELETKREAMYLERLAEIKKMLDESFSRMKQSLDSDQQRKLDELRARYEERMKHRKGHPRGFL